MSDIQKHRKFFVHTLTHIFFLAVLFLSSCGQNPNKNKNFYKGFIDIYKTEINTELCDMKKLIELNPYKYKESYNEIKDIQCKFDTIYSRIERNDLNIIPSLKEIENLTKEHQNYKIEKKIEIILNMNIGELSRNELLAILNELNCSIISQIRFDIDKTDYKFNSIRVLVVPEKKVIKVGDTYKASVVIVAIDSTRLPKVTFVYESKNLQLSNGIIQIKGEKKGKFKSKGNVELIKSNDGIKRCFPFEFEFEVQ